MPALRQHQPDLVVVHGPRATVLPMRLAKKMTAQGALLGGCLYLRPAFGPPLLRRHAKSMATKQAVCRRDPLYAVDNIGTRATVHRGGMGGIVTC